MTAGPDQDKDLTRLLREANPVRESDVARPAESAAAQDLYQRITGIPYAGRMFKNRRRRARRIIAGLVVSAGLGAAGVAAASTGDHTVVHTLSVSCYASDSLQADEVVVSAEASGPVASCVQAWSEGQVGHGSVPLLVACVSPQGVAAVFPSAVGADVCGQLDLPALPAGQSSLTSGTTTTVTSTSVPDSMPVNVEQAIIHNLRATCMSAPVATSLVEGLLAKEHLSWTVQVPKEFPAGRPCASPGFSELLHKVVLTGIPPLTKVGS